MADNMNGINVINSLLGKVREGRAIRKGIEKEQRDYELGLKRKIDEKYLMGTVDRDISEKNLKRDAAFNIKKQSLETYLGQSSGLERKKIDYGIENEIYKLLKKNDQIYQDGKGNFVSGNQIIARENALNNIMEFKANEEFRGLTRAEDNENERQSLKLNVGRQLGLSDEDASRLSLDELNRRLKILTRKDKVETELYVKRKSREQDKTYEAIDAGSTLERIAKNYGVNDGDGAIDYTEIAGTIGGEEIINAHESGELIIQLDKGQVTEANISRPNYNKVNPRLGLLAMPTINDENYKKLTDTESRFNHARAAVNENIYISDSLFGQLSTQDQGRLRQNLKLSLFSMFTNKTDSGIKVEGGKLTTNPETTEINWAQVGFNWKNLPNWAQGMIKGSFKLDDEDSALVDISANVSSFQSIKIDDSTINKIYDREIERDDFPNINKQELIKESIKYHAHITGKSINSYIPLDSDNDETKNAKRNLVANAIMMAKDRSEEMVIANNLMPIYYDEKGRPRDVIVGRKESQKFIIKSAVYAYKQNLGSESEAVNQYMNTNYPNALGSKNFTTVNAALEINAVGYFDTLITGLAESIKRNHIPGIGQDGPRSMQDRAPTIYTKASADVNLEDYRKSLGIDLNANKAAMDFAAKGITVIDQLTLSLDATGTGSAFVENLVKFVDGVGTFPAQLSAAFGLKGSSTMAESIVGIKNIMLNKPGITDADKTVAQNQDGSLNDPFLNKIIGELEQYENNVDLNDYFNTESGNKASDIAKQQALHSMAVYFIAAALQGEGGKAISDADREFVQWALQYSTFSNVEQRKGALEGVKFILAKVYAQTSAASSDDVRRVWASQEMDKVFGKAVMNPEHYPPTIVEKYKKLMEVANQTRGKGMFNSSHINNMKKAKVGGDADVFGDGGTPVNKITGAITNTSIGYSFGNNEVINLDFGLSKKDDSVDEGIKNKFVEKYGGKDISQLQTFYALMNDQDKIKLLKDLGKAGLSDFVNSLGGNN